MSLTPRDGDAQFAALLEEVGHATPIPLSALHAERFLVPGERLLEERFVVGEKLGEGGMGVVYEAFDAERGARVALKLLSRVDAASIVRFKHEFRSLAEVVHPHLSRMHSLFCWHGSWFFSMELLPGASFLTHYRRLHNRDEQLAFLRRALLQLEAGISALHRMGKLHCDLKPSNVFVSPNGHITIVDFGLVVDPRLAVTSHTLGTPGYMAPELLRGQAPSPASDWYALGVVLHQALTGTLPEAHLPALRSEAHPHDLSAICEALLSVEPEARHEAVALIRGLASTAENAAPVPTPVPQLRCIGRDAELATLHDALAQARTGKRVLCRIAGASGIGKSTLLRAFLESLSARDTLVLHGRCYERELTPFKLLDGVVDALADELSARAHTLPAAALAAPWLRTLARAFPSMSKLDQTAASHSDPQSSALVEEQRNQLRDALSQALQLACDGRLAVLAIDDAQWTDADGAALCASLLESAPLLLIIVQRDELPVPQLQPLSRAVQTQSGALIELPVAGLSAEEMHALVQQLPAVPHVLPDEIARESQGSPYLAIALLQYARTSSLHTMSPTLEEALCARMEQLPPDAIMALQLVAVSGAPIEARVLERACTARDADRAVALLRAHSLLRSHGNSGLTRVDVYHDRVRNTVLAMLSLAQCRELHLRLAEALEIVCPTEAEQLALHLQAAGEHSRAAPHAWRAGRRAAAALAFEQAATFLAQAGSEGAWSTLDAAQLARELGDVLAILGRAADAGAQYLRASQLSHEPARHKLALLAAGQLLCGGQLQEGFDILRANLAGRHGPLPPVDKLPSALSFQLAALLRLLAAPPCTSEAASDTEAALQVDACYWAALGLAGADMDGSGSYLVLRQAVEALELGEPLRIVRALELTAAFGASTQSLLMAGCLTQMAELAARIAEPLSDPRIPFWREFRLVCQANWAFDRVATHHHLAAAERCASACHGVHRERLLLWFFTGFCAFEAGRVNEHFARAEQVHCEARACRDRHAQMWSDLTDQRALLSDEAPERLRLLSGLPDQYGDALEGFSAYALEWQLAAAERAAGKLVEAHTRMHKLLARARETLFWWAPTNRALFLSETVAACLALGATHEHVAPWLDEAETLLAEHPAPASWLLPYRAGIAFLRGDQATARRLLASAGRHFEVANSFWTTRSARLLLAALDQDQNALRQVARELLEVGVKAPLKLAQLIIPGIRVSGLGAEF